VRVKVEGLGGGREVCRGRAEWDSDLLSGSTTVVELHHHDPIVNKGNVFEND
jgi:hypothetical protein